MTDWVAVSVDIHDDPKIAAFAEALGISNDSAIARLVQVWGRLARHDNEQGAVGDVPDRTLEKWAGWDGKAGKFAPEFRARFTVDGRVNGWWDWNGRMLARARAERERKRRGDSAAGSAEIPQNPRGGSGNNTGTGPNRTEPNLKQHNDNRARDGFLNRFPEGLHREAVDRAMRVARNPDVLVAELKARLDGMPGHQAATGEEIGKALHDMQASESPPLLTPKVLDIWVERGRQTPAIEGSGETDTDKYLRQLKGQKTA